MPFKSMAQRRLLYAKKPAVAAEFEAATPKGAKLPEHVGDGQRLHAKMAGQHMANAAAVESEKLEAGHAAGDFFKRAAKRKR